MENIDFAPVINFASQSCCTRIEAFVLADVDLNCMVTSFVLFVKVTFP